MKWLVRAVLFIVLCLIVMIGLGGNVGPYELVLIPVVVLAVMWVCIRLVRLGQD